MESLFVYIIVIKYCSDDTAIFVMLGLNICWPKAIDFEVWLANWKLKCFRSCSFQVRALYWPFCEPIFADLSPVSCWRWWWSVPHGKARPLFWRLCKQAERPSTAQPTVASALLLGSWTNPAQARTMSVHTASHSKKLERCLCRISED